MQLLAVENLPQAGDHICGLYRDQSELELMLVSYLGEGLRRGHRCFFIDGLSSPGWVVERLSSAGIETRGLNQGQLELLPVGATYLRTGQFAIDDALAVLTEQFEKGQAQDFPFTRLCGTTGTWASSSPQLFSQFMAFENRVNSIMAGYSQSTLCFYDLNRLSGEALVQVLRVHPKMYLGGMVVKSPFYLSQPSNTRQEDKDATQPLPF